MTRKLVCVACLTTAMLALLAAPAAALEPLLGTDNTLPGVPQNWYPESLPVAESVGVGIDEWDFYQVPLEQGDIYSFSLAIADPAADLDLYLYAPYTTDPIATATGSAPNLLSGTAATEGIWSVAVRASAGASGYELQGDVSGPDDDVPGVGIAPSGTNMWLDSFGNWDDLYRVWLSPGETLWAQIRLESGSVGFSPELVLYGPSATSIWNDRVDYLKISQQPTFPKSVSYVAPAAGWYYLDVYERPFGERLSGGVFLDWSIAHPVHRFYNSRTGVHFYTATETEKAAVIATLSGTYQYEGVSYNTNPYTNGAPLYRFYRPSTGTHFYTASEAEKNNVVANLSGTYRLDGPAYNVSFVPVPGALTVWRFYNRRTGTHFYTADPAERQNVQNTLGGTYTYEGPAFYIAP